MSPLTVPELAKTGGIARRDALEAASRHYNHPRFRAGDPVAFVWAFDRPEDREIAAWAAAALSYGRVASIQRALADLDRRWEGRPFAFLAHASSREQENALRGFIHRWTRADHLLGHLRGYAAVRADTSIPALLAQHARPGPGGLRRGMARLADAIRATGEPDPGHLLPDPSASSACKRPAMWLRWMTRRDHIDPGLWADHLSPAQLWVPLDTHMFRIARRLRLTRRRVPDGEAARRVTAAFARIRPDDPVRYDFAITRLGMGQG